jgi:hypothetical protein
MALAATTARAGGAATGGNVLLKLRGIRRRGDDWTWRDQLLFIRLLGLLCAGSGGSWSATGEEAPWRDVELFKVRMLAAKRGRSE